MQSEEGEKNEEADDQIQVAKTKVLSLIKQKIEGFIFQKVVSLSLRNESIDPPEAFTPGSKCPNVWVLPSFALRLWFFIFVLYQLLSIGEV